MSEIFLWLAMSLCQPLDAAEASAPKDMPNSQIIDEYWERRPAAETSCHWQLWKQALSREIAFRLARMGGGVK